MTCRKCALGADDPVTKAMLARLYPLERRRAGEEAGSDQGSEGWLSRRNELLTASDGNKFIMDPATATYARALASKTGKNLFSGGQAVAHGQQYEDEAIREFTKATGHAVVHFGLLYHPDCPDVREPRDARALRLGGSPDGITLCGAVVEVKCPWTREIVPGVVPRCYIPQVQILMQTTGLDKTFFVQYRPPHMKGGRVLDVAVVDVDPAWWTTNLPRLREFWARVVELGNDDDRRAALHASVGRRTPRTEAEWLKGQRNRVVHGPAWRAGPWCAPPGV
jgi:hypothetical protein